MSSHAPALAHLNGLYPDWATPFGMAQLDIRQTDPLNNDNSVRDTIALMSGHAVNASSSWQVNQALENAGANNHKLSESEQIERIFNFIHSNVQFVEDPAQLASIFEQPANKELLITPEVLISMDNPMGDCDDFSMLSCAMLLAKGIKCDFVTIAANRNQPNEFSHVYCQVTTKDGQRIPFDASHGSFAGWETQSIYRKQVWPVLNWKGKGSMTVSKQNAPIWASQFKQGLMGLALGDCDDYGNCTDGSDTTYVSPITGIVTSVSSSESIGTQPGYAPSSGGTGTTATVTASNPSAINWNNILPGLFAAVDKVAIQTTQPAGVSTQTCNAAGICSTSQSVLPAGALGTSSLSSIFPLLLIGLVVFAVAEK